METSLGTVFHDVFGDEKLFIFDDFNEKFLDLVVKFHLNGSFREMASSNSFTGKN